MSYEVSERSRLMSCEHEEKYNVSVHCLAFHIWKEQSVRENSPLEYWLRCCLSGLFDRLRGDAWAVLRGDTWGRSAGEPGPK